MLKYALFVAALQFGCGGTEPTTDTAEEAAKGLHCRCNKGNFGCSPSDSSCLADCSGICDCRANPWGC